MATDKIRPKDLSRNTEQLVELDPSRFLPLPPPYDKLDLDEKIKELTDEQKQRYECGLDGVTAALLPRPKTEEEKKELVEKFFSGLKKLFNREDNWTFLMPLFLTMEFCAKCQTCAEACPIGADNGLVTRELRKLFSQEMNINVKPLHRLGSVQQLEKGSSTGMTPVAFLDNVEFMEDEVEERAGLKIKWPMDKEGAEILLIHNAGEFLAWPENPEAFAIILEAAGVDYTLSSELVGYDSVNYGVWYDDVQFAKVALKHTQIAKKLGVKKIVLGECGHAHKALTVIADRVLAGDYNVPRESSLTLLNEIIKSGRLKLDPSRNDDITATLHDPCNLVRLMGVVKPQREIIKAICNNFREMTPHGVHNYCCGGSSGFAIMQDANFPDWRHHVASRVKLRQILDVFQDIIGPEHKKYVCAPCSNCKGALRDMFVAYGLFERCNVLYGGLVELIVNAMVDIPEGYLEWEWH